MKRLLSFILALVSVLPLLCVPAKRNKTTLTLADRTQVKVTLRGDETFHFYQSEDERAFILDSSLRPLEINLHEANLRLNNAVQANNNRRARRMEKRKAAWGAESNPISGKKKGLVILANFSDKEMYHSQAKFNDFFNLEGYSENYAGGSVHDYFYSQSYGQFDLTFDVVGPVTVSKPLAYYGENDSYGNDKYAAQMVAEAVQLADEEVNFANYDWDGDGMVEQVFIIYAGYGENADAPANTIWPHEYELSIAGLYGDGPGALNLDGVTIDTYACSCELEGNSGLVISGIGTACHEFSHCMCLPDMYDINGVSFGMDAWDIMDYGCYNGYNENAGTPTGYTSYERMYCGWLTPIELTEGCSIKDMPALTNQPVAYILRNEKKPSEYYMLENRQQESWDAYNYGHGMLILHVDFDKYAWMNNEVNAKSMHQRMTIIPADNLLTMKTLEGDTWPGPKMKTSLTDDTTPAAKLYNENTDGRKFMGKPITDISETNGKINFKFNGGAPNGITSVQEINTQSSFYDLTGRKIAFPRKGIYIKNGKKQLIQQ